MVPAASPLWLRGSLSVKNTPAKPRLSAPFRRIAGHPLAQNERCLHMFLQERSINKNYTPGKVR